jgi:hypothetical protein
VDWCADHTGILRFQPSKEGEEQVRFWHRLFREYLAANRLAQLDTTATQKVDELWERGWLLDPFWEDVVRLLPRALGTIEKGRSLRDRLELLAGEHSEQRGRVLGLAMAAIIENRDLFPDVQVRPMAERMAKLYEAESSDWELRDRVLFLEGLGRLDPEGGDPRIREPGWLVVPSNIHVTQPGNLQDAALGWAPVTVQEFRKFLESSVVAPDAETSKSWRAMPNFGHPNWPAVVERDWAERYCSWLTGLRSDIRAVRLLTEQDVIEARRLWPLPKDIDLKVETEFGLARNREQESQLFRPVGAGGEPKNVPVDWLCTDVTIASWIAKLSFQPFRCVLTPPQSGAGP